MIVQMIAVTLTFIVGKSRVKLRSIKYDLDLLRSLRQPSTLYDLLKKLHYPHASLHRLLREYSNIGLISVVKSEPYGIGKVKRYYKLNERGEDFLKLVEDMEKILQEGALSN
jgi:DNA-binding IclR family transcriptional regulator